MAQEHINDDIFRRLDAQDEKLDQLVKDVAYMRGLMDGQKGAPIAAGDSSSTVGSWMTKQNAITVALAGLITTIGTVLTSIFAGK